MKRTSTLITAFGLSLFSLSVLAAVPAEEVAKLGVSLTPLGGEMAGNVDGSIPAWTGGLPVDAAPVTANGFLGDPYAGEKALFTITAQNVEQYRDKLSPGMLAMFKRYPETFSMPVFVTHRSASIPKDIAEKVKISAAKTSLIEGGNGLKNFTESRYYAFPIPQNGLEAVWNHITRYRGGNLKRLYVQAAPQANGVYSLVNFEDEVAFPDFMPDLAPQKAANALLFFKQRVTAPSRLAGNVLLVHDSLDQIADPRMAWMYNAGQRRVRRAPQVAYDGPGTAADGLRTSDNFDMYNGAPDRYDWKLKGKREMYIPYNNFRLLSPSVKYADLLKPGHTNQELSRYELHRVWEVEATLKAGQRNIYAKRTFFIDEDTWTIVLSDLYDGRGQLWRVGEAKAMPYYQRQIPAFAFEALYDLTAGRYIATGLSNEEKQFVQFDIKATAADFTPAALRNAGVR
ncbi:DUF1329 domain-containing protein [Pseudomonas sp. Gutcm_11s]|uniref:DUF1329 domain-containing protein n=1 Tax=Pseudomonas sp. Gutcm_11s TaxID=3026088 RepID=UPI0023612291|nr:DUF1329 domain-containing protein [Pseudomonas sp. Gutcm_11s]MDD0843479.1 DUF1329 domain-containing protein [Pseudomonas sp. Gutcm_11s]